LHFCSSRFFLFIRSYVSARVICFLGFLGGGNFDVLERVSLDGDDD